MGDCCSQRTPLIVTSTCEAVQLRGMVEAFGQGHTLPRNPHEFTHRNMMFYQHRILHQKTLIANFITAVAGILMCHVTCELFLIYFILYFICMIGFPLCLNGPLAYVVTER